MVCGRTDGIQIQRTTSNSEKRLLLSVFPSVSKACVALHPSRTIDMSDTVQPTAAAAEEEDEDVLTFSTDDSDGGDAEPDTATTEPPAEEAAEPQAGMLTLLQILVYEHFSLQASLFHCLQVLPSPRRVQHSPRLLPHQTRLRTNKQRSSSLRALQ